MKFFKSFTTPKYNAKTMERLKGSTFEDCINMYPVNNKLKAVGFKTFRGMVSELRKVNKNCKKYNFKTEIRFTLPLKW